MTMASSPETSLEGFLERISKECSHQRVVEVLVSDIVKQCSSFDTALDKENVVLVAGLMKKIGLDSQPRLSKGFISIGIESSIFFFSAPASPVDHQSSGYRTALTYCLVAVAMARIDGQVHRREWKRIENIVNSYDFLTSSQKDALIAYSRFLLSASSGAIGSEQYRDHIHSALKKETVLSRFRDLGDTAKRRFLNIAMEVAVSDEKIVESEVKLLQEFYREMDLEPRAARRDLLKFAEEKHIRLKSAREATPIKEDIEEAFIDDGVDEISDALSDLLEDFDSF